MSNLTDTIDQIIHENNLPFDWPEEVLSELGRLETNGRSQRNDLRKTPFITIDGKDAKDFDDAVFCEKNKNGFILQVAIADVAEIVKQESQIDKEAIKRGTSIYFPKKVIPMLPEKISNNLCSLVPKEDRNVLVCNMKFDTEGVINSYEFNEAVINSYKRFTYNEVEYLLSNNDEGIDPCVLNSINSLKKLTKKLLINRTQRYALEINSAEPMINFKNNDEIADIYVPKRLFSHQMIEEAMISANVCAAKYLKKHFGFGIYRVHEEPENLKIQNLKKFFSLKGLSSKSIPNVVELINSFIEHINKKEENKMLNILILQSLKRAAYSTKEIGHFGLQLNEYSHFTSPIRRYPDLITHRLIKNILKKDKKDQDQDEIEHSLETLSSLEKRAEIASRQVTQQLICHRLKEFIGDDFSSMVVGITDFGLFCEIENYFISGLIHVSDLSRDRYIFDKEANILKGRRTGRTFRIGQKIIVKLANVIPEDRKIVLIPK